jgi:luciferase family oxidoreductase group 1
MKLSILDQSIVNDSIPQSQAIVESIETAKHCEQLGYYRYWVSEHHNSPSVAGTAPEILVSAIAASTQKIRVGSAGVLLHFYSPYKVAEQFSVIESFAPDRIDLGVGRAPGADGLSARALNENFDPSSDYKMKIRELQHWLDGIPLPGDHIHGHGMITANPLGYSSPEIWLLGSSAESASIAAELGLPYSFAHFFNDGKGMPEALDIYRNEYIPSERFPRPVLNICISCIAADSHERAMWLNSTRNHWRIQFENGMRTALKCPAELKDWNYSQEEKGKIDRWNSTAIIGTVDQIENRIRNLSSEYDIDEFVLNTWTYDLEDRLESYSLMSKLIS